MCGKHHPEAPPKTRRRRRSALPIEETPLTDAQRAMVQANVALVYYHLGHLNISNRSDGVRQDRDDLVQIGMLALCRAVREFDPTLGVAFAPFAVLRIRHDMHHYLVEARHGIRVPASSQRRMRERALGPDIGPDIGPDEPTGTAPRSREMRPLPDQRVTPASVGAPRVRSLRPVDLDALVDRHDPGRMPENRDSNVRHLLRERFESIGQRVLDAMPTAKRSPDGKAFLTACWNERWRITSDSHKTSVRALGTQFDSAMGRVTHCERTFFTQMQRALERDPATQYLASLAQHTPEGIDHILDPQEFTAYESALQ